MGWLAWGMGWGIGWGGSWGRLGWCGVWAEAHRVGWGGIGLVGARVWIIINRSRRLPSTLFHSSRNVSVSLGTAAGDSCGQLRTDAGLLRLLFSERSGAVRPCAPSAPSEPSRRCTPVQCARACTGPAQAITWSVSSTCFSPDEGHPSTRESNRLTMMPLKRSSACDWSVAAASRVRRGMVRSGSSGRPAGRSGPAPPLAVRCSDGSD